MGESTSYIHSRQGGRGEGNAPAGSESRRRRRFAGLLVAAPCWALLAVAAMLTPSPSGAGTHRQLALPGCSFLQRTGWPCPTCGMTTSVSAAAHGRLGMAWKAHPAGAVLLPAVVLLALAATAQVVSGRRVVSRLRPRPWWIAAAIGGVFLGWGVRLLTGAIDGTLPMR